MKRHIYVAIEGPIGVGKTTLARMAHETFGWELLLEVFEENPFLSLFYKDRERYAFPTQIFFLLSRYRQQHDVIPRALRRDSLVSDYLFDKDYLFARVNLRDKEFDVYELVHNALAEQIPNPHLVVHLQASTDTLMERIAFRDRPYERQVSRSYIDQLRLAYEDFFGSYKAAPVLRVDTTHLNIVGNPEDRAKVLSMMRSYADLRQPPAEEGTKAVGTGQWRAEAAWESRVEEGDLLAAFSSLVASVGGLGLALADETKRLDPRREVRQASEQLELLARMMGVDVGELRDRSDE